jgi:hypothetical protein
MTEIERATQDLEASVNKFCSLINLMSQDHSQLYVKTKLLTGLKRALSLVRDESTGYQ